MWLNCSYSKQYRDHNDNSRTTTMKLEREDRFDKPEAVDSMKWIDSYSRLSPWHGHGTRILRPTRVRDYGTKDFPHIYVARMQILTSRCIPDEFTIFFSPLWQCARFHMWNLRLCYENHARCRISFRDGMFHKKILALHNHFRWNTNILYDNIFQTRSIFQKVIKTFETNHLRKKCNCRSSFPKAYMFNKY